MLRGTGRVEAVLGAALQKRAGTQRCPRTAAWQVFPLCRGQKPYASLDLRSASNPRICVLQALCIRMCKVTPASAACSQMFVDADSWIL